MKDKLKKGKYKVKFSSEFNENKKNKIILTLTISRDLKELIKYLTIDETTKDTLQGRDVERFKYIKSIWRGVSTQDRTILCSTELLNKGQIKIEFDNITRMEEIIDSIKYTYRTLLKNILKAFSENEIEFEIN